VTLRHGASRYEIIVENPQSVQGGIAAAELDGAPVFVKPSAYCARGRTAPCIACMFAWGNDTGFRLPSVTIHLAPLLVDAVAWPWVLAVFGARSLTA